MQILRKDWADAAKRWIGINQPRARVAVLGDHLMLVEYAKHSMRWCCRSWAKPNGPATRSAISQVGGD